MFVQVNWTLRVSRKNGHSLHFDSSLRSRRQLESLLEAGGPDQPDVVEFGDSNKRLVEEAKEHRGFGDLGFGLPNSAVTIEWKTITFILLKARLTCLSFN